MRSAIFDRLTGQKARVAAALEDQFGWGRGPDGQVYSPETRKAFVEAYRDRVWAGRCVDYISSQSNQVRLEVRVRKQWTDEHDMLDLFRQPYRMDPAVMFFERAIFWGEIVGDWFFEIIPSIGGGISELFPLRSYAVEVKAGEGGVTGYIYDRNENQIDKVFYDAVDPLSPTVTGKEGRGAVIAGRHPNPFHDYYGMPPMRKAKDAIVSDYYMVKYDHKFFRNSARPDLVIGFKGDLSKTAKQANKEMFEQFKGADQAHKALILQGAEADVNLLSQTPRDSEYIEGRRQSREEQCAAFGVFPVLVSDMTRATYSNFESAEPIFWKATMLPKLAYFASWANAIVRPFFEDVEEFRFNVAEVPAMAKAEGWRVDRAAKEIDSGLATPDEGRDQLGREPLEEDGSDVLWRPTKSRPIHDIYDAAPEPELKPAKEPAAAEGKRLKSFAEESKDAVETWLRNALDAKLRFALRARTELTKHFADQERDILAILDPEEKQDEVEAKLLEYGWKESDDNFREVVEAMQAALADKAFEVTATAVGGHEPSEGLIERTLKEIANRKDGIGSVTGRVKDEVIEQVREGLSHGLTYRQIAEGGSYTSAVAGEGEVTIKGVQGVYEEYKTWQAERIARTEAAVTFNRSSAALMRDAGITHVDIADGDEDEDCALANGSRWTLAEYEGNPIGHPNCTRIGLPVVEIPEPS